MVTEAWWQLMLWGAAGGAVFRVGWNLTKAGVIAALDHRLEHKRQAVAREAVADPEALANRLGLPVEVVKRFAEGQAAMQNEKPGNPPAGPSGVSSSYKPT